MNRINKFKLFAFFELAIFLVFALVPSSTAFEDEILSVTSELNIDQIEYLLKVEREFHHELLLEGVGITVLQVAEFDPFYDVHFLFRNYEREAVSVVSEHTLTYPNGQSTPVLTIDHGMVPPNEIGGAFILCGYVTQLYGEYTWSVILRGESGNILDEQSYSWIRDNPHLEEVPFDD